jgi:tetratricopeptide (TPR) repeat protein
MTAQPQQAHQQSPGDFWVNHGLAFAYSRVTPPRHEEALRHYTAALALRPGSVRVRINLAAVLFRAGRHDEAARYCQEAIAIQPSLAEAHFSLGLCQAGKGRPDAAIAAFHEAIRHRPDYVAAHVSLGRALRDAGRFDEAIASCDRAIRLDSTYAPAHDTVGIVYLRAGKPDKAIPDLTTYLQLRPEDDPATAPASNSLAVAACEEVDEAVAAFRKAIRLDPALDGVRPNLAGLLYRRGSWTS